MKSIIKIKKQISVMIICILALLIGFGISWDFNKATTTYAATAHFC